MQVHPAWHHHSIKSSHQFELYIDSRVYVRFYDELKNSVLHPNCTCSYQNMVELDLDEIEQPPQI